MGIQLMDLSAKREAAAKRTFEEGREMGLAAKRDRGELARPEVIAPGPIVPSTTDDELYARAARAAHIVGAPAALVFQLLRLERRVAVLEALQVPPHLQAREIR